jgi:hypothetical protein
MNNIEWISWPPLLCKHKNAVAIVFYGKLLFHRQIRPVYAVTLLPCRRLYPVLCFYASKVALLLDWTPTHTGLRLISVVHGCLPMVLLFRVFPAVWRSVYWRSKARHILSKNIYSPSRSFPATNPLVQKITWNVCGICDNYELSVVWTARWCSNSSTIYADHNDGGNLE